MRFAPLAIFAGSLLGLALLPASASTISNLSTGQNGSGVVQSAGDSIDANWIYNDPFLNSTVPNGYPTTGHAKVVGSSSADSGMPTWLVNDSSSAWIAPDPDVTNNGSAPYTFTDTFNLTGFNLSSVALSGAWGIDDSGTVSLNGHVISTLTAPAYSTLTAFSAPNADFVSGTNTLTITMTASDGYLEAVRLNGAVTGSAATAAPEPSSLLLLALGGSMALLGMAFRQRASGNRA